MVLKSVSHSQVLDRWVTQNEQVLKFASACIRVPSNAKPATISRAYLKYLKALHDLKCDVQTETWIRSSSKQDPNLLQKQVVWLSTLKQSHQCVKEIVEKRPIFYSSDSSFEQFTVCETLYDKFKQNCNDLIGKSTWCATDLHQSIQSYQILKRKLKTLQCSFKPSDSESSLVIKLIRKIKKLKRQIPLKLPHSRFSEDRGDQSAFVPPNPARQSSSTKVMGMAAEALKMASRGNLPLEGGKTSSRRKKHLSFVPPHPTFTPPVLAALTATSSSNSWKKEVLTEQELNAAKLEFAKDVPVTAEMVTKLVRCMPQIMRGEDVEGVTYYDSQPQHNVFSLDIAAPGFIFKVLRPDIPQGCGKDNSMKARYDLKVYAKGVCMKHGLNDLIVPSGALLQNVQGHDVLAEQVLDFNPHQSQQEELFKEAGELLQPALDQYTHYLCLTGQSGIYPGHNPVLTSGKEIGLLDVEFMNGPKIGLYEGDGRGLFYLLGLKQMERAQSIVRSYNLNLETDYEKAVERRRQMNADDKGLKAFYRKRKISVGDELLVLDSSELDFSKHPLYSEKILDTYKANRLKRLALEVIKRINQAISNKSPRETIAGRRCVNIDTHDDMFSALSTIPVDPQVSNDYEQGKLTDEQFYQATFLGYAIQKLIDLELVFKVKKRHGGGYLLQA